jgi:hypothetical protein
MCQFWLFLQKIEVLLTDKPYYMASSQRRLTSVNPNVYGKEAVAGLESATMRQRSVLTITRFL